MPKSFFQEIIFTIIMVFFMVYTMICYNIALAMHGMSNTIFVLAFKELLFMAPVAFIFDMIIAGPLAKIITFKVFNPEKDNIIWIIMSISFCSVWFMCPLMSGAATIIFKGGLMQKNLISMWLQATVLNYPMAFIAQFLFAGPVVRKIFSLLFKNN